MKLVSAAAAALVGVAVLAAAAVAAVAPGTYKGSLYQAGGAKIANAPATITVVGTKVTITAPRLPIKCLAPTGTYTAPSAPTSTIWKGVLKGNAVSGNYIDPLGGTGEYFTAKLTYAAATKSFSGKLGFVGRCQGTSTVKAKKA